MKMNKGGKDYIVYRQPGSGVSVCKKTSTAVGNNNHHHLQQQHHSHLQHPPKSPHSPTNLSLLIDDKVAMFEFEECIFGSTSPRCMGGTAMTTSDYINRTIGRSSSGGNNESDNNISSCSTLDIGYKVENIPEFDLKNQLLELSQRLQKSERERDEFRKKMEEAIDDKEQVFRRLEMMSSSHESRITEMHCVIAELSKKLRNRQDNVIMEETEVEGSEISYQEGSVYDSEMNLTNPDIECQTEGPEEETNLDTIPLHDNMKIVNDSMVKSQMDALQEEVLHLRAEIALLQSQIAINPYCSSPLEVKEEFIKRPEYENEDMNNFDSNERNEFYKTDCQDVIEKCIPKIAEKVKLKQNIKPDSKPEIIDREINKTELMIKDFSLDESSIMGNTIQKLQNRIEQYKMKNSVLSLTLRECKEHCDHLYLLCGKYESNALALQSALNCSDRAIEAYDVMLALLESKLALSKDCSQSSRESRKAVEAVAQHLLDRLDSEKDLCENSLGPWQNTFSINSMDDKPWTIDNDNRLRNHVSKLKGRRSALQNTLVVLESPFSQIHDRVQRAFDSKENIMEQTNLPVSEVLDNLNEALNKKRSDSMENSDDQGLLSTLPVQ